MQHEDYISFAQVGRPHGLQGAFFLKTPDRRREWDGYKKLFIETAEGYLEVHVSKAYTSNKGLVLQLKEITSINAIEELYDKKIYVHKSEIRVAENEFVVHALVGCFVISEDKKELGIVVAVSSFGAQENLEIKMTETGEHVLYPFLESFVKKVDTEKKLIEIVYIPEFFEGTS